MIRQLGRDIGPTGLVMIPVNLLLSAVLVGGSVISGHIQSGVLAIGLLVAASIVSGVLLVGLARCAARYVEHGQLALRDVTALIGMPSVLRRGALIGLAGVALPIIVLGQLHLALIQQSMVGITSALLCVGLLLLLLPLGILVMVGASVYAERPMIGLVHDAIASLSASPRTAMRLGVWAVAIGAISVVTIAPMLTCYATIVCLLGARLVVAPKCHEEATVDAAVLSAA